MYQWKLHRILLFVCVYLAKTCDYCTYIEHSRYNVFTHVNICPYGAIYLPVDCYFGEPTLFVTCWSSTNQTPSTLS